MAGRRLPVVGPRRGPRALAVGLGRRTGGHPVRRGGRCPGGRRDAHGRQDGARPGHRGGRRVSERAREPVGTAPFRGRPTNAGEEVETDLHHHGDAELAPGLVDLAVNVRAGAPPPWLRTVLHAALDDSAGYPVAAPARAAVAAAHGREPAEVLLTAGAAEAFVLLARALRPHKAVVVHPSFTEPEAALRAAGHPVTRHLLRAEDGYRLDPVAVPEDADLVVLGNPTNPTSVLHPAAEVAALARPGRVLVVDEAFADTTYRAGVAGEPESLAGRADLPGLVVVRSLTKTWGLAGLRIGYLLAPADLVRRLRTAQPLWPVSTPALAAAIACASPVAQAAERRIAERLAADRDHLVD